MSFLKKAVKALFAVLLSLVLFPVPNVAGSAEIPTYNRLDCLYPVHLRYDVFYDGKLTDENIVYLKNIPHAEALKTLNVLRGDNRGNLMLDRYAERVEGAAMLVRLLGAEEYAFTFKQRHPFTDVPDWAVPYIGYLYQNGLTNGIGDGKFGSHHYIDEKSYLAFLLRTLGYSEKNGDFTWETVGSTALKVGLLEPGEEKYIGNLIKRERLSQLSWRAMFLNHKQFRKPLLICLYEEGKISRENLKALFAKSQDRLIDLWYANIPMLEEAFLRHEERIEIPLNQKQKENDYHTYLEYTLERIQLTTGVFLRGFYTELWQHGYNYTLVIYPNYENTLSGDEILKSWVDLIALKIFTPTMNDYDKVKAAHDYLITVLEYDTGEKHEIAPSSFSALGALETGVAVCNAYSELMALILNRGGVPCRIVVGEANGTSHAWNIVSIDGKLYHVDVTWDDPVINGKEKAIRYDYFNLPDAEIERDHYWNRNNYPVCNSTEHNYFVRNNLIVKNPEDIRAAVADAVENRKTGLMLKYLGDSPGYPDIRKIINDVNSGAGYIITRYVYTINEAVRTISLESIEYAD